MATEVKLSPGWLLRDVRNAAARLEPSKLPRGNRLRVLTGISSRREGPEQRQADRTSPDHAGSRVLPIMSNSGQQGPRAFPQLACDLRRGLGRRARCRLAGPGLHRRDIADLTAASRIACVNPRCTG